MAGRPFLQALELKIEGLGGEDAAVFEPLADGASLGTIAAELGVSRPYMYVWRDHKEHRERRREKWELAMKLSASTHAELAGEVLEKLAAKGVITNADVNLAKARSEYRRWLAGKRDPEAFGDKQEQVQVNVSIGQLHLDALRARGSMHKVAAELPGASARMLPASTED